MKTNSIKNYFQNKEDKEIINATSKELQQNYSFIEGIDKVKGNYYSKLSNIVELMINYAKETKLIDIEEYNECIIMKNQNYNELKGILGEISMIINQKEYVNADIFNSKNAEQRGPLKALAAIYGGDPDLEYELKD